MKRIPFVMFIVLMVFSVLPVSAAQRILRFDDNGQVNFSSLLSSIEYSGGTQQITVRTEKGITYSTERDGALSSAITLGSGASATFGIPENVSIFRVYLYSSDNYSLTGYLELSENGIRAIYTNYGVSYGMIIPQDHSLVRFSVTGAQNLTTVFVGIEKTSIPADYEYQSGTFTVSSDSRVVLSGSLS